MVDSINSGFQQIPASKAFEPGQAPKTPAEQNPPLNSAPDPGKAPESFTGPGQTEQINEQVALSRDTSRVDPSQISSNNSARGSVLDIVV